MKRHLIAFVAAAAVSVTAFAQSAPVDVVRSAVEGTVNAMKADPAARGGDMAKITQVVETRFLPVANFERTTRIAVGSAWSQASPAQQQELYKQFRLLMTRTYAASLAQLGSQDAKFTFKAGGGNATDALVQSTVSTPGDTQNVGYPARQGRQRLEDLRHRHVRGLADPGLPGAVQVATGRGRDRRPDQLPAEA